MDESLIVLCRKGDRKAQRRLFDTYSDRLFRVCYRYLQNQMDAEDALISGFVKIFQNINKMDYRNKQAAEGWMKKIMINECLMFLRKERVLVYSQDEQVSFQESSGDLNEELEVEDIYAMILKLPTGYRTVFNLYAIEGYNHKEIGRQLGISENTSKSQLHKARMMLQGAIKQEGNSK